MYDNKPELIELTQKYTSQVDNFSNKEILEGIKTNNCNNIYDELIKLIKFHNYLYYIQASPIISDLQYDKLFSLLVDLEEANPDLIIKDSPTQKIKIQVQKEFKSVKHKTPLLSLENSYNAEDLKDWETFLNRQLKDEQNINLEYFIEPKFDGVSIELIYRNGNFRQALTRGDGIIGEDITENIKVVKFIPQTISELKDINEIIFRGEIVIPKTTFQKLNEERSKKGENLFANPRNLTAGSLRQLDPNIVQKRGLVCFVYDLIYSDKELNIDNQKDLFTWLSRIGFNIYNFGKTYNTIEEVIKICLDKEVKKKLDNENIEYDGLVIKLNNFEFRNKLGNTGHHPRRAKAYKYPAKQIVTKLLSVDFQVGRTGTITPVANLEKVEIGGVKISRASLHNFDYIKEKDIRIGDWVWVQRSGEVIPYILGPVKERRDLDAKEINPPTNCPVCDSKISRIPGEVSFICSNINCKAQVKERLIYFVSKECMDIDGFGDQIIDTLVETSLIKSILDIYKLHQPENKIKLGSLPLMGSKRVSELLLNIEKSKNNFLRQILNGFGIKFLGKKTAQILTQEIKKDAKNKIIDYNLIIEYLVNEDFLLQINGIGEKLIESLKIFFTKKENIKLIEQLSEMGIKFDRFDQKSTSNNPIGENNESFSISGKFEYSRNQIINILEKNGFIYHDQPTKKTNFILIGEGGGSKLEKAKNYNIEILQGIDKLFDKNEGLKQDFDNLKKENKKEEYQSQSLF